MKIRMLRGDDLRRALPMEQAIGVMKAAFGQFSAGEAVMPLRSRMETPGGVTLLMPAYLKQSRDFTVKIVSVFGGNPQRGLPTVSAMVVCLDPETGMVRALMDGDALTAIRTGAAGGLAADLLARRDAKTAVLFGTGVQGRSQLAAAMAVRRISRVILMDPVRAAALAVRRELEAAPGAPAVEIGEDLESAVGEADIILAATTSPGPLFDGRWLKPGTHVTGVGSFTPQMQELDLHTIARGLVVVDSREACRAESGDIINTGAEIHAELGEIVRGVKPGRTAEDQITVFKSVGLAVQDAAAAGAVLAAAEARDMGDCIDW